MTETIRNRGTAAGSQTEATGFASAYKNAEVLRCTVCASALEEDDNDNLADAICSYCEEKRRKGALRVGDPQVAKQDIGSDPVSASALDSQTQRQLSNSQSHLPASVVVTPPITLAIPKGHILVGMEAGNIPVTLDLRRLVEGRCLVQGFSGAGKSKTLRRIIELAHTFTTMVILDIEGEFSNLADHIGAVSVRAADVTAEGLTAVALRTREHRIPLHLDLTDLEPDTRIAKASAFLSGLLSCAREHWKNTIMVVIDEAHLLAPQVAATSRDADLRRLGVATLTDLCSRGRKRGICPVIATQRLAKLAASVRSELQNVLIGMNVLDRDIATAGAILGFSNDRAALLRELQPGQFIAFGPALSRTPRFIQIGGTVTEHVGATPDLLPSAGLDATTARRLLQIDTLKEMSATAAPAGLAKPAGGGRGFIDAFLLEPAAVMAVRVVSALIPISPNAATVSDICRHLNAEAQVVQDAIDVLARYGAVDTIPRANDRIARISPRLRTRLSGAQVVGLA